MILITGGGGFLGLNVARHLVDRGEEVLLLDNRPIQVPPFLAPFWDKQAKGVVGDLLNLPQLFSLVKQNSVDSIIHTAVLTQGNVYQVLRVNVEGTTNVLEAGRIFGLRRVTFMSSSTVYFGAKTTFHEDMDVPVKSQGFIEATKKASEQICFLYVNEYGLSVAILRPSRIYGPLYYSGRFPIGTMIEQAVAHKTVDLSRFYGANKAYYIYVKDCARGISLVHLAKTLKHSIYNLTDTTPYSYSDFTEAIKEVIPDAEIRLGTTKSARDVDYPNTDTGRIKEELAFIPEYDLKQAVKDYIAYVKDKKY